MKRKKRTIIIMALAVFSALIAGVISFFYYKSNYELNFATFALTIRNIISCFAFVPSLSATEILKWLYKNKTTGLFKPPLSYTFFLYLTEAYSGIILIAPICTASAVYVFIAKILRQLKWKIMPLLWNKPKENIMIIGSGSAASDLISSVKEISPDREIYYISAKTKTVDEEADLMKRKIHFCTIDLVNCPDHDFLSFINNYKLENMDAIIVCENSDAANFSIYIRLMKLGSEILSKNTLISCKCEEVTMMNLFSNYYDDNREQCIPPKLFSLAHMRVSSILEKQPLPFSLDNKEISYMVVGFGMTGQAMVRNMMNLGVARSQSKLVIHVVDRQMDSKESMFLRQFSSDYVNISKDMCTISSDHADGMLEIHFHKMDIRSREFEILLQKSNIQYASVCLENVDHCLDCMQTIQKYITNYNKHQLPVAVSLLSDPEITVYLNHDTKRFKNVLFIGISTYYNIDQILSSSLEKQARKFHQIYQNISVLTLQEYQDMLEKGQEHQSTPWEDMLFYKQEASRMLSRHQTIKEKILEAHKLENKDFLIEEYFGEKGSILQKNGDTYVFDCSVETLMDKINSVPFLKELGMMEHRRWCYCQAADGWSYAPSKNELKKQTPYLVPWDQLCREHPEVCIYDYMAYFL